MANAYKQGLFSLAAIALAWLLPVSSVSSAPIIIHHPNLQGEDFSPSSLIRIYAMQKRVWSDKTAIKVFTLPKNNEIHKEFVNKYLLMQPYQLDRLWHRLVFSGTGSIPEELSSIEEMIEIIGTTPGAIGYVDDSLAQQINPRMLTVTKDD